MYKGHANRDGYSHTNSQKLWREVKKKKRKEKKKEKEAERKKIKNDRESFDRKGNVHRFIRGRAHRGRAVLARAKTS